MENYSRQADLRDGLQPLWVLLGLWGFNKTPSNEQ
jgi:hypothetical protein